MEEASSSSFIYFHERFHLRSLYLLPWKLPPTSIEVEGRPASVQVAPASMEATNYFHVLPCTSMAVGSGPASIDVTPDQG